MGADQSKLNRKKQHKASALDRVQMWANDDLLSSAKSDDGQAFALSDASANFLNFSGDPDTFADEVLCRRLLSL